MEASHAFILLTIELVFGFFAFFTVFLRISHRLYTRMATSSDWFLAAAMVSLRFGVN